MSAFDPSAAAALIPDAYIQPWLRSFVDQSRKVCAATPLPQRKTEAWKYTSLSPLTEGAYLRRAESVDAGIDPAAIALDGLAGTRLVFVNGRFHAALSSAGEHPGCTLTRFADASAEQRKIIDAHLGSIAPRQQPFVALNDSWLEDGVLVHVTDSMQRPAPLHLVHFSTANSRPFSAQQRLLVVLEAGCEASIIEHFASGAEAQNCFLSGVTECQLQAGARLQHYRLHLEEEHGIHIGGVYAQLQRGAQLDSFCLALGGALKRIDLNVQHQGPGSECRINGVYLSKGRQHVDIHANIEHEQGGGTTSEVFRGIVDDSARAVFNGRIHIHPQAQKTLAELSNRNLLLSNTAEVYTKPELEIYADDVRCAHGATVSQIDDRALYYMQSRGIERREAEIMLSFGFINELLNQLPLEPVRQRLRPLLSQWFGEESRLTRHLS